MAAPSSPRPPRRACALAAVALAGCLHAPVSRPRDSRFRLTPSGGDDAPAIESALRAAAASGPGALVELGPGTFVLHRPIEVADFDGTFRGQGRGVTIVRTLGDGAFPPHRPPAPPVPGMFLFYFVERAADPRHPATLRVQDMTLQMVGKTAPWRSHRAAWRIERRVGNMIDVLGRMRPDPTIADPSRVGPPAAPAYFNVSYVRLDLAGDPFPAGALDQATALNGLQTAGWWSWQIYPVNGFKVIDFRDDVPSAPASGKVEIRDCRVDHVVFPFGLAFLERSTLTLQALRSTGGRLAIVFDTVAGSTVAVRDVAIAEHARALLLSDVQGSAVTVERVDARGGGIEVREAWSAAPSRYLFAHNRIDGTGRARPGRAGFEVHAFPDAAPGARSPAVTLEDNTIVSPAHHDVWGPIFVEHVDGLRVVGNTLMGAAGDGFAGIQIFQARDCRIGGNDLTRFRGGLAPILLKGTRGCVATGPTAVLDIGGVGDRLEGAAAVPVPAALPDLDAERRERAAAIRPSHS